MLEHLRRYPVSLIIIAVVIYLSFFKPPQTQLDQISNLDKVVHFFMYFGLGRMLWLEYLRSHKNGFSLRRTLVGAVLLPILFSGCIELGQEYLTTYRGGDWKDFAANTLGVIAASLIAYYFVKPRMS